MTVEQLKMSPHPGWKKSSNTFTAYLLCWLFAATSVSGVEDYIYHSQWWPPSVRIVSLNEWTGHFPQAKLTQDHEVLFIRMEDRDALVDAGNGKVIRIPPDWTDLKTRMQSIQSGETEKEFGNFNQMIAGRIDRWTDGKREVVNRSEVHATSNWLLLYHHLDEEHFAYLRLIEEWLKGKMPDQNQLRVLEMPMYQNSDDWDIRYKWSAPSWFTMPAIFSRGYASSLDHRPTEFTLIQLDKDGRILDRLDLPDDEAVILKFLQRLTRRK